MRFYLTGHSRQRMRERDISLISVEACVRRGRRFPNGPGRWRYVRRGLEVVVSGNGEVITAYRPGEDGETK